MDNEDRRQKPDELEEHSLPGANQAGKGPSAAGPLDPKKVPGDGAGRASTPRGDNALRGTNQAGKKADAG